jgi:pimeloyl-ACP methyl ester carboxylesterase/DNA-binding CsgD family transcriptional regulator
LDNVETVTAGLARFAPELEAGGVKVLDAEVAAQHVFAPQIRWEHVDAAAFDRFGRALAKTAGFSTLPRDDIAAREPGAPPSLATCGHADGRLSLAAVADAATARRWHLPGSVRTIAETPGAAFVAVSAARVRSSDAVAEASAHLGLSPLQAKIVAALVKHGDLERAAQDESVAYSTAREALAIAMERTGSKKRSALIERVVALAFGVMPEDGRGRDLLRDAWGLTPRQAALAIAVAQGASREEAARVAGVSAAAAKKDLANIFIVLGVASATELSALLSEANALGTLLQVTQGTLAVGVDRSEPLRFVPRREGGLIAFSDYGPRGAKPVLVLHSSSASRPAPSRLVAALQAAGFRPFAIDRPGFGLTDPIAGGGDPFAAACADIRTVCAHLRFKRIDVVARGGAQVLMHLVQQSQELVGRAVLVAPDPSSRSGTSAAGILNTVKNAFRTNTALIEPLTRMLVATLQATNVRDLVLRTVRDSPPDVAVMTDARNLSDYYRGFQMFLSGRVGGYVREQAALVTAGDPPAKADASHWHVLIGAHDPLHLPADIERYWRKLLPNTPFETITDGGRFLVMSHARKIAELLRGSLTHRDRVR